MRILRPAIPMAVASLIAIAPGGALAHSPLVSSTPSADAELAAPPDEVALVFDAELSPDGTGFTVTDAKGTIVGTGELDLAVADRNEVRGPVEIALPGRFDVAWVAVALDGHEEAGAFGFTVGEPAQEQTPDTAVARASAPSSLLLGAIFVLLAIAGGARHARKTER